VGQTETSAGRFKGKTTRPASAEVTAKSSSVFASVMRNNSLSSSASFKRMACRSSEGTR
jgi:hypothetical protein